MARGAVARLAGRMAEGKASVLVVAADRTAASDELAEAVRVHASEHEASYTLLVPATPGGMARVADMRPDEEQAEHLMEKGLERLRATGAEMEGRIGDAEPVAATQDAVNFGDYDEIIVSTSGRTVSKVVKMDLAGRVEGATGLPVTRVTATELEESD